MCVLNGPVYCDLHVALCSVQVTWDNPTELEAYITKLQGIADRLTTENRRLRKCHFQLVDKVYIWLIQQCPELVVFELNVVINCDLAIDWSCPFTQFISPLSLFFASPSTLSFLPSFFSLSLFRLWCWWTWIFWGSSPSGRRCWWTYVKWWQRSSRKGSAQVSAASPPPCYRTMLCV